MMATYVTQRRESFVGELIISEVWSVNIYNPKTQLRMKLGPGLKLLRLWWIVEFSMKERYTLSLSKFVRRADSGSSFITAVAVLKSD